jgi:hypothetical protein
MNEMLMRAVVEAAAFAALSGDDVIQPDAAVSHLEQLGAILNELSPSEQGELKAFFASMADSEKQSGSIAERIQFLRSLADSLGLAE